MRSHNAYELLTGKSSPAWQSLVLAAGAALGLAACGAVKPGANVPTSQNQPEGQAVSVVKVVKQRLKRVVKLPGELLAYRDVPVYPKVKGFVEWIDVDRGSPVKKGQLIIRISAPELEADVRKAEAEHEAASAANLEARARLESALARLREGEAESTRFESTAKRFEKAALTPGAVALNDVEIARQTADAQKSRVDSLRRQVEAQQALVRSTAKVVLARKHEIAALAAMHSYLKVQAPFDGVITERNVHEGSLVSSSEDGTITAFSSQEASSASGSATPSCMVRLRQTDRLRLVVPVPEAAVSGLSLATPVSFTVSAYPEKVFSGAVARIGRYLDRQTRTMPVELDVDNSTGDLSPGMFPLVSWPSTRPYPTLFVPEPSLVSTLRGTHVVRVKDGVEELVSATRGQPMGSLIEVLNTRLAPGDTVVLQASEDMKAGTAVTTRLASPDELFAAARRTSAGGE